MVEKKLKNTQTAFDERDLDQAVLDRLKVSEEREAKMIANFNAKVNSEKHHEQLSKSEVGSADESGGPSGLEPTRYGDWERKGRCYDF